MAKHMAGGARAAGRVGAAAARGGARAVSGTKAAERAAGSREAEERPARRPMRTNLGWYALAFVVPVAVLVAGLVLAGVAPFGAKSIVSADIRAQYVDFYAWFRRVLEGRASLFYMGGIGLGQNGWPVFSYYLSNPLNLLVLLFDDAHLSYFFLLVVAIKVGVIGVCGLVYFRRRFALRPGEALLLSTGLASCVWVTTQLTNPMWLDVVAILPLAGLSTWRLVCEGRWGGLLAELVVAVVTCWYMAYMLFLFVVVLWAFERAVCRAEGNEPFGAGFLRPFARLCCVMLGALLVAGASFVPTVMAMAQSAGGSGTSLPAKVVAALGRRLPSALVPVVLALAAALAVAVAVAAVAVVRRVRRAGLGGGVRRALVAVGVLFVLVVLAISIAPKGSLPARLRVADLPQALIGLFLGTREANVTPQLYAGASVLVLVAVFVASPRVPAGVRRAFGMLVGFLALGFLLRPLYYVWCGMRMPNGYHVRMAVFFVFALEWAAAYALTLRGERAGTAADAAARGDAARSRGGVSTWGVARSTLARAAGACLVGILAASGAAVVTGKTELLSMAAPVCCVLACALLVIRTRAADVLGTSAPGFAPARLATAGLIVLLCAEMAFSQAVMVGATASEMTEADYEAYALDSADEAARIVSADQGVYRVERTYSRAEEQMFTSGDESLSAGQLSLSAYVSATDANAMGMLTSLGYGLPGWWSVRYTDSNLVADALLGVRYVSSSFHPFGYVDAGLGERTAYLGAGARVWENPYALPLGYGVASTAAGAGFGEWGATGAAAAGDSSASPFESQNAMASALVGHDVTLWRPLEATLAEDSAGAMTWQVEVPAGLEGYLYTSVDSYLTPRVESPLWISVDGGEPIQEGTALHHSVHPMGEPDDTQATTHTVTLTASSDADVGYWNRDDFLVRPTCTFYALDVDALAQLTGELSSRPFEAATWEDGFIEGDFVADADTTSLLLTVPNAKGWTVEVNSERVEPAGAFDNGLMVIPVASGQTNHVRLTYLSPGIVPGLAMSAVSLAVLAVAAALRRGRR
ncbi:YfhO family protein [uncultured Parolsenella sp.]|uniref:YfhO family protein n=1 Tax=uncultured Parolsenella sp. TaxID=2083008 RepID=UPI0027D96F74|nr:YfhO family protein [uncultured Parolsenella sp.]